MARQLDGPLVSVCLLTIVLAGTSLARSAHAQSASAEGSDATGLSAVGEAHAGGTDLRRPRRPRIPPLNADEAELLEVEEAMRAAPARPLAPPLYRGRDDALEAARIVVGRAARFMNYRAATPLATWRESPAYQWRVRSTRECHAHLRELGIGFIPYDFDADAADASGEVDEEGDEPVDPYPTPAPVILRSRVEGVSIIAANGEALMSCELATRLPTLAKVAARHGVTRIMVSSLFRPGPAASFHTFGMAMDIPRVQVEEPLAGPEGTEPSRWLTVASDYLETPEVESCDPSLFADDSPLGGNERGRRLAAFACDLFATGVFSTVLTPNYNEGHRGHFHIDIRPDDNRIFMR